VNASLPLVVDRLLAVLPTLPGWTGVVVFDGPTLTRDALQDYVTVGFVDGEDFGGSAEHLPGLGDLLEESETVRSEIVSQTGDDDMKGRRNRAFELFKAWQAWVQSDSSLGVPGVTGAALSWDYQPVQNQSGTAVRLAVTLTYIARGV